MSELFSGNILSNEQRERSIVQSTILISSIDRQIWITRSDLSVNCEVGQKPVRDQ